MTSTRTDAQTILLKQFSETSNAGDQASAQVVSYLCRRPVEVIGEAAPGKPNLIAIGSILHWADRDSIVWGSGLIAENVKLAVKPKSVLAVRGHLTWEKLKQQGIDSPQIFGDPGVFLPSLYPRPAPRWPLGIVPHYVDRDEAFVLQAQAEGAKIVDVTAPVEQFAAALSSCERILSSSLHGLIFAHAYGIPGGWVKISNRVHGDGFKFFDYYSSIGVKKGDVPLLSANQGLGALSERCHLPLHAIDREALRRALIDGIGK